MGKYIPESDINDKQAEIKKLTGDLEQYVADFAAHVNEIQDLLVGLSVCLNTTGGVSRIKDIANIEFDTVALNEIVNQIEEIQVTYKKVRQDV